MVLIIKMEINCETCVLTVKYPSATQNFYAGMQIDSVLHICRNVHDSNIWWRRTNFSWKHIERIILEVPAQLTTMSNICYCQNLEQDEKIYIYSQKESYSTRLPFLLGLTPAQISEGTEPSKRLFLSDLQICNIDMFLNALF